MDLKNKDNLKNEDDVKYEDNLKNEEDLKKENNLKNEEDLENWPSPFFCSPHIPLKNYLKFFLITSHCDSHTTTDVTPEMIPGF